MRLCNDAISNISKIFILHLFFHLDYSFFFLNHCKFVIAQHCIYYYIVTLYMMNQYVCYIIRCKAKCPNKTNYIVIINIVITLSSNYIDNVRILLLRSSKQNMISQLLLIFLEYSIFLHIGIFIELLI